MINLNKLLKRGPQIITPKDASLVLAYSGVLPGSRVVDAGSGSGHLAIFIGTYIQPGKVYTYEIDDRAIQVSKENIKSSGLSDVVRLKRADITKGIKESNLDLITLDLKDARKVVKHAHKKLKNGGVLMIYSPTIEHLMGCLKEVKKLRFEKVNTVESIVREWKTEHTTRPITMGIMHTGFLTFATKNR